MRIPNSTIIISHRGHSVRYVCCMIGVYGQVRRSTSIGVDYQDLQGERHFAEFHGLLARGMAHEMDHLDQVVLSD